MHETDSIARIGADKQVSGEAGNSRNTPWLMVVLTAAEILE